jgi:hypothetical protein
MFAFEPNLEQRVREFDIDIYEDQMLLKEFLLERVVEEITEAFAAFRAEHYEHYLEEIVDVFNFIIETHTLLRNVVENDSTLLKDLANSFSLYEKHIKLPMFLYESGFFNNKSRLDSIRKDLYELIQLIGEITNLLKQRPWRESQYPVDLLTFKKKWLEFIQIFFDTLIHQGIGYDILSGIWSKKYQVNKFRIESNY